MKNSRLIIVFLFIGVVFAANGFSRPLSSNCDSIGRINGVFHTSCYPWISTDGTLSVNGTTQHNDTARLKFLIEADTTTGKIFFDEAGYFIDDSIRLKSFRTLIGTGRPSVVTDPNYYTSRIVQTANGKAVFTIGGSINFVSIRDIALISTVVNPVDANGNPVPNTTVGILAQNGLDEATSGQSLDFEFTNLSFYGFDKGIYVNAQAYSTSVQGHGANGYWRFDNVKLDHTRFESCRIGVHINSSNSGWTMKNILAFVPEGPDIPVPDQETYQTNPGGIDSSNINSVSMVLYLEKISYSKIDEVIGDGTNNHSSALIYVGQHFNLNIQNTIDEGFRKSIYVYGGDLNNPVNLTNNYFQSPLIIRNSYVVSTANQFMFPTSPTVSPARAVLGSKIFSLGDKFCFGSLSNQCNEATDGKYETDGSSQVIFSSGNFNNTMPFLRIGTNYYYDIARNTSTGFLNFTGNQAGYSGYTFNTNGGGTVQINYDGSVTYGTKTYSTLGSPVAGTVIYCSDCQKTTPCTSGSTTGAIAKRLGSSWDCN